MHVPAGGPERWRLPRTGSALQLQRWAQGWGQCVPCHNCSETSTHVQREPCCWWSTPLDIEPSFSTSLVEFSCGLGTRPRHCDSPARHLGDVMHNLLRLRVLPACVCVRLREPRSALFSCGASAQRACGTGISCSNHAQPCAIRSSNGPGFAPLSCLQCSGCCGAPGPSPPPPAD